MSSTKLPSSVASYDSKVQAVSESEKATYVVVGEVTTLEHEVGDDTVEAGASITEALLTSGKSAEVLGSLGDDIIVQLEDDTAKGSYIRASSLVYQLFP